MPRQHHRHICTWSTGHRREGRIPTIYEKFRDWIPVLLRWGTYCKFGPKFRDKLHVFPIFLWLTFPSYIYILSPWRIIPGSTTGTINIKSHNCKHKIGSADISLSFDDNKDFNWIINFDMLMVSAECFKQIQILKQKLLHQKLHAQAKDYLKRFWRPVSDK